MAATTNRQILFSAMVASLPTKKFSFDGLSSTITVYRPSGAQVIRGLCVDLEVSTLKFGSRYRLYR